MCCFLFINFEKIHLDRKKESFAWERSAEIYQDRWSTLGDDSAVEKNS